MKQLRHTRRYQVIFIVLFVVVILFSILSSFFGVQKITLVLLLIDFPIALLVAIFGSLAIREEEEEKS